MPDLDISEQALLAEIARLNKIIQALMNRVENSTSIQGSDFNLFQTAITLEDQVRHRTDELEAALRENEKITRALSESENHNRLLIENSPMCIHEIDMNGRLTSMNRAGLCMLGLKEECEVQGLLYLDAVSDPDRVRIGTLLAQAYAGETSQFEFNSSGPLGRIYKSCFVPIKDKNGGVKKLMGITEDVTEHNKADEALNKIQRLLNETEQIGKVGGWEFYADTRKLTWTKEIYNIHEVDTTFELTVEKAINFYAPASRPIIERAINRAIEYGEAFDVELEIVTAKGNLRDVHAIGETDLEHQRVYGFFQDITERKSLEDQLAEREALFRAVFNQASIGIELIDPETLYFVEANPAACRMLGYTHEEFLRLRLIDIQADLNEEALIAAVRQVDASGGTTIENRHRCKNGDILDVEIYARMLDLPSKRLLVGIWQDITERKLANQKIKFLAYHDKLTKLPNRELFYDRLSQAISQAKRKHDRLAILFLDLDGFKAVNDSYGHEAGDIVLKAVAMRLKECVRGVDTVARLGGDEFTIILGEVDNKTDVNNIAKKIIQKLTEPVFLYGMANCNIGVSIGIAMYPDDGYEIDKLMTAADSAMYESKSGGKKTYTFFKNKASGQADHLSWIVLDADYLLGEQTIDQQHRELVNIINRLNDAVKHNVPTEVAIHQFDEMITYARAHFEAEERMMNQYGYAGYEIHKKMHQRLMGEANYLRGKFTDGGELLVLQYIKDWLLPHILEMDKPLASFLSQQVSKRP